MNGSGAAAATADDDVDDDVVVDVDVDDVVVVVDVDDVVVVVVAFRGRREIRRIGGREKCSARENCGDTAI